MILHLRLVACLAVLLATIAGVRAQSCNPAVVSYLVRDERGAVLNETDLKSISAGLAKTIGDASVYTSEVSFADDTMQTYFWPESVDWPKGKKMPVLEFANAATCTMHLSEVTLTWHGQLMHLIFNLDVDRTQRARRIVIDSLPFQEGTFALDLDGWSRDPDRLISSGRWKTPMKSPKMDLPTAPLLTKKSG